jgi:tetratricopeptide (TPR) repeat protein
MDHGLEVLQASRVATSAGFVALLAGDPAAAERELRPACERLEEVGELGYLAGAVPLLLEALFEQGHDEEALQLTERWRPERLTVPEDVDSQVGWRRVRAKLLARRGDVEEAGRLAREATALATQTDYLDLRAQTCADLAEVLRLAGDPRGSAAAREESIQLYEQKGNIVAATRVRSQLAESSIEI